MSGNKERGMVIEDSWINDLVKIKILVIKSKTDFEKLFKITLDDNLLFITQETRDYERDIVTFYANRETAHFHIDYVFELRNKLPIVTEYLMRNKDGFMVFVFKLKNGWYGALAPMEIRD